MGSISSSSSRSSNSAYDNGTPNGMIGQTAPPYPPLQIQCDVGVGQSDRVKSTRMQVKDGEIMMGYIGYSIHPRTIRLVIRHLVHR